MLYTYTVLTKYIGFAREKKKCINREIIIKAPHRNWYIEYTRGLPQLDQNIHYYYIVDIRCIYLVFFGLHTIRQKYIIQSPVGNRTTRILMITRFYVVRRIKNQYVFVYHGDRYYSYPIK